MLTELQESTRRQLDNLLVRCFSFHQLVQPETQVRENLVKMIHHYHQSLANPLSYVEAALHMALVLVDEPVQQNFFSLPWLPSGIPLISRTPSFEGEALPSLYEVPMIGLFALVIGIETGDEAAKAMVRNIAQWQDRFMTVQKTTFLGIWLQETDFASAFTDEAHRLFYKAMRWLGCARDHRPAEYNDGPIEVSFSTLVAAIDTYIEGLPQGLWKEEGGQSRQTYSTHYYDDLATVISKQEHMEMAISFCGYHTGLGSLIKKNTKITTFGPHWLPLGEPPCFGVSRTMSLDHPMEDVFFHVDPEGFNVSGWTKSIAMPGQSKGVWIKMELAHTSVETRVRIQIPSLEQPLFFAFFIAGEVAQVTKQSKILPNTLDHYRGESRDLWVFGADESLFIHPCFTGQQEVISLAGGNHFWGSDFLVCYSMELEDYTYEWIIK